MKTNTIFLLISETNKKQTQNHLPNIKRTQAEMLSRELSKQMSAGSPQRVLARNEAQLRQVRVVSNSKQQLLETAQCTSRRQRRQTSRYIDRAQRGRRLKEFSECSTVWFAAHLCVESE